jgi:hypothetical protein
MRSTMRWNANTRDPIQFSWRHFIPSSRLTRLQCTIYGWSDKPSKTFPLLASDSKTYRAHTGHCWSATGVRGTLPTGTRVRAQRWCSAEYITYGTGDDRLSTNINDNFHRLKQQNKSMYLINIISKLHEQSMVSFFFCNHLEHRYRPKTTAGAAEETS